jgi:putative nucleotidyltransferase with HDIG domain
MLQFRPLYDKRDGHIHGTIWKQQDAPVTTQELFNIKRMFERYVHHFADSSGELHPLLQLKVEHSTRVAAEADELSSDLGWCASERHTAQAAGLLHDIGRFSQYAEFGTFSDAASVDHGERGAGVLREAGWLSNWRSEDAGAILFAVRCHNRLHVPATLRGQRLALLRLVRDADKLDILRIVLDAVERDGFRELPAMLPHIRLDGPVSPQVREEVSSRKCVSLRNVKSLAEFLLMQLSWVYDLNYPPTLRRFHDRGIVPKIMRRIDGDHRIHALGEEISRFVLNRATIAPEPSVRSEVCP